MKYNIILCFLMMLMSSYLLGQNNPRPLEDDESFIDIDIVDYSSGRDTLPDTLVNVLAKRTCTCMEPLIPLYKERKRLEEIREFDSLNIFIEESLPIIDEMTLCGKQLEEDYPVSVNLSWGNSKRVEDALKGNCPEVYNIVIGDVETPTIDEPGNDVDEKSELYFGVLPDEDIEEGVIMSQDIVDTSDKQNDVRISLGDYVSSLDSENRTLIINHVCNCNEKVIRFSEKEKDTELVRVEDQFWLNFHGNMDIAVECIKELNEDFPLIDLSNYDEATINLFLENCKGYEYVNRVFIWQMKQYKK